MSATVPAGSLVSDMLLQIMQEDIEHLVRQRIRSLRLSRDWTLDALASRCELSASTISRIETGHQRVTLEHLVALSRALDTSIDRLVEPAGNEDVVIRPEPESIDGNTFWLLSRERDRNGHFIAKMRLTPNSDPDEQQVHPGHEWFTVLSGVVRLRLGEREILVYPGQAVEFSTMTPHLIKAHEKPAELLILLDREGENAHRPGHSHHQ